MIKLAVLAASLAISAHAAQYIVYVGSYTKGDSKGISAWRFDTSSGDLQPLGGVADTPNPSFFAVDPHNRYLFAVNEEREGKVSSFRIDAHSGKLTFINQVSSHGSGPCYVSVDKTDRNVLVANYNNGSIAVLPVGADGKLGEATTAIQHKGSGPDKSRQKGPHAHYISPSPNNRYAVVSDLGLDELLVYKFDAAHGTLTPNDPPYAKVTPASGPRHFAFAPNHKFGYVITEMGSTVIALTWDGNRGVLNPFQTLSTLPADFHGENSGAEIEVHPNGKFVYASNRGHDTIAVFSIASDGKLTQVQDASVVGKNPRNFKIDPTGRYLFAANQDSNNVVLFRLDPNTGKLTPTGKTVEATKPVCVNFVPAK